MKLERQTRKILVLNWVALVVMHFTILGSAYLDMHWFNTPFIVALALIQMVLILLYFMEVRWSTKLAAAAAFTGFFFLAIQWTLAMSDYLMRQWH